MTLLGTDKKIKLTIHFSPVKIYYDFSQIHKFFGGIVPFWIRFGLYELLFDVNKMCKDFYKTI